MSSRYKRKLANPKKYGIVYSSSSYVADFNFYVVPEDVELWLPCPYCQLKPKVWEYDNGRQTMCGCTLAKDNKYAGFHIGAESIMSVYTRTGKTGEYDIRGLRKNWNFWVETGQIVFSNWFRVCNNIW